MVNLGSFGSSTDATAGHTSATGPAHDVYPPCFVQDRVAAFFSNTMIMQPSHPQAKKPPKQPAYVDFQSLLGIGFRLGHSAMCWTLRL